MVIRSPNRNERGATSIQVLVILVPVVFALLGFAWDLGQLYLSRTELKAAADSMALAAAQRLVGTDVSAELSRTAVEVARSGSRYNFSGTTVGQTDGTLTSEIESTVFSTVVEAASTEDGGTDAASRESKYVRVRISADAPLTFWRFMPLPEAQEGRSRIRVQAVAGLSAPLCTACGIEPIFIQAVSPDDLLHFGFAPATRYTFYPQCIGAAPAAPSIAYQIADRYNVNSTSEERPQLYRIGAAGLPPLPTVTQAISTPSPSCMGVGETLTPWSASTTPILVPNCNAAIVDDRLTTLMCGLYSRFDNTAVPDACVNLTGVDSTIFQTDTFIDDLADYSTEYQGNGRRVITVAVVDPALTVLGFRQFLLEPGLSFSNGRFSVLYVATTSEAGDRANLVPVRQGSIGGCQQVAGPGKVVLHQ